MLSPALASLVVRSVDRTHATTAVGDPSATRTVYGIVVALVVLGVACIVVLVWLVRATRPDPELLAPLEVMDTRRWRRLDPAGRRRLLDEVRPEAAEPLRREQHEPAFDEEFVQVPPVADFDDLTAVARRSGDGEAEADGPLDEDLALVFDDTGGQRRGDLPDASGDELDLHFDDTGGVEVDAPTEAAAVGDGRTADPESDSERDDGQLPRPEVPLLPGEGLLGRRSSDIG